MTKHAAEPPAQVGSGAPMRFVVIPVIIASSIIAMVWSEGTSKRQFEATAPWKAHDANSRVLSVGIETPEGPLRSVAAPASAAPHASGSASAPTGIARQNSNLPTAATTPRAPLAGGSPATGIEMDSTTAVPTDSAEATEGPSESHSTTAPESSQNVLPIPRRHGPPLSPNPLMWTMPDPADVAAFRGESDPNLRCTPRVLHFYHDAFLGGYDFNNSEILRRLNGLEIDWRLKDYGCYTGYSVHGNGIMWTSLVAEQQNSYLRPTLGVDPVTGRALDVTSSKLTYMYHAHELFHDDRLIGFLPAIASTMMRQYAAEVQSKHIPAQSAGGRTLQQSQRKSGRTSGAGALPRRWKDERYTLPNAMGALHVVEGHALVMPIQHERFVGQAFTLQLNMMARFWATGALLETKGTIVAPEPKNAVMLGVLSWMYPLLPNAVHHVKSGEVVYMAHSHYVTPSTYEHPDPCARKFLRDFLLPRAIGYVRKDKTFKYGDETKRADPSVSDWEWAKTLPEQIAVVKTKGQSRQPLRVFALDDQSRGLFKQAGYTFLSDSTSLLHRFVLVNFADLSLVTFGSLLLMMTQIYCRDDLPADKQARFVSILQQGYHGEEFLFSPVYHREGSQDGARIIFTNFSIFNPPNMWFKHVLLMGETFAGKLTLNHLRFDRADCTLGNRTDGLPPDPPTKYVMKNPLGDKRKFTTPETFARIPGMNECFSRGVEDASGWMPTIRRS